MEFVDIAGLVAGASKGEGLGKQFLANIRETRRICPCGAVLLKTTTSSMLQQRRDPKREYTKSSTWN